MKKREQGQSMVIVAIFLMGAVAVGTLLIVNSLVWFNTRQATLSAVTRAAHDGAAELAWTEGIPLTAVTDPEHPDLPTATARHCLNLAQSRSVTLNSLQENLALAAGLYVTGDGEPLSPAQVVTDTTGTYLVALNVVNPATLNCPDSDPEPVVSSGQYDRPYVHLVVQLPMKAMFGSWIVRPTYQVDVTSSINPAGAASGGN